MKKIMMRNKLIFLLILCMCCAGCSGEKNKVREKKDVVTEQKENEEKKNPYEICRIEEKYNVAAPYEGELQVGEIKEQVLYDDNNINVIVTGIRTDEEQNLYVDMKLQNNREKVVIMYGRNVLVNGYMIEGGFYTEVAPGETVDESMCFYGSELGFYDLTHITDIKAQLVFNEPFEDAQRWSGESETFVIKTSLADSYTQEYNSDGAVLYDEKGLLIVARNITTDREDRECVEVYVENNTGEQVNLYSKPGYFFGRELPAGTRSVGVCTDFEVLTKSETTELTKSFQMEFEIFFNVEAKELKMEIVNALSPVITVKE